MISTQSFYIAGLEDPEKAKGSAFGAMFMFILTFGASIYGIHHDAASKQEEIQPEGGEGYQLNTGATEYGSRYD